MLKKLFKHDLDRMTLYLRWVYVVSIALSCITRLIKLGNNVFLIKIIGQVFEGLTYAAIVNTAVNTFIHIWKVFQDNFFKDHSYLTHTLPVTKNQLIDSKFLASLVVIFSGFIVVIASLFIMLYSNNLMDLLKAFLVSLSAEFNISAGLFITLIAIVLFSQVCAIMAFALTATVKGYSYNTKRPLKGICWFLTYYFGCMISTVLLAVVTTAISGDINNLFSSQISISTFIIIVTVAAISYTLHSILFYFLCKKEFNKGVNID